MDHASRFQEIGRTNRIWMCKDWDPDGRMEFSTRSRCCSSTFLCKPPSMCSSSLCSIVLEASVCSCCRDPPTWHSTLGGPLSRPASHRASHIFMVHYTCVKCGLWRVGLNLLFHLCFQMFPSICLSLHSMEWSRTEELARVDSKLPKFSAQHL